MYDIEIIKKINKTDPELARLMLSSREGNRPSNVKPLTGFKKWLHETDPWAFRVSDAVFTLAIVGITALAFVFLPATTAICLLPVIAIAWLTGFVMNH